MSKAIRERESLTHLLLVDLKARLTNTDDEKLERSLKSLESKRLTKLYRDGRGTITLIKQRVKDFVALGRSKNTSGIQTD
jgi:hypothetical protein